MIDTPTPERRRFVRRTTEGRPPGGDERRVCQDRRHDLPSRERIEWLEIRYRRVTELLFASMLVTLAVCTLGLILFGAQAHKIEVTQQQFQSETKERINQGCLLAEARAKESVDRLKQTYDFLVHPPADLKGLIPYAMANLNKTEQDALDNAAPPYCDAPNIGLPEPNPVIPPRPLQLGGPPAVQRAKP